MSRLFRIAVVTVVIVWGLAPQIACLLPDRHLTQDEMDCCEKMSGECGRMEMSCCKTVVRTDVPSILAKTVRNMALHTEITPKPVNITFGLTLALFADFAIRSEHAPPPDVGTSSLILRI